MPSRKKAQGRERKAKSKPVEAPLQSNHPRAAESCRHGAPSNVPPACRDFVDDVVRNYEKEEVLTTEKIFEAANEMLMKHQQVAQDASLIGIVRSVYVSEGVSCTLEEDFAHAAVFATSSLVLDMLSDFSSPATIINADLKTNDLVCGNDRAVVKWLTKNAPCSCLKQTLRDLRKAKDKTRKCWGCKELVEISKLMACDGCKVTEYCSEECQKADWRSGHKDHCVELSEKKKYLDQHRGL